MGSSESSIISVSLLPSQGHSQPVSQKSYQQRSDIQLDEALLSSPSPPSTYSHHYPQSRWSLCPRALLHFTMQTVVSRVNVSVNKKCLVLECSELNSPTMWHSHRSLHAEGIFPGEVPSSWLSDQNLFICSLCNQLVSNSRTSSRRQHSKNRISFNGISCNPP